MRFGSVRLNTDPSPSFAAWLPSAPPLAFTCPSENSSTCMSFSLRVICERRSLTLVSIELLAAGRAGWSAASSLDCVAATTPPAAPAVSATADTAIAARLRNLAIWEPPLPVPTNPGGAWLPRLVANDTHEPGRDGDYWR